MNEPTLAAGVVVHQRYRVVRPIGRGGMGAVYEAIDERLGHRIALKQTLVVGDVADRAFEREARLLAALRHHALPVVSDFFEDEAGRFLVMQFIPGQSLAELVKDRGAAFPVAQVLDWAEALLRALEYLHGRQPPILHRDIKPANLKVTGDGEVVLLDFGLAKGSGETTSTGPSVYGLTPQYAPLEQFQGSGTDETSDLFALAGTLHFLMTHEPPVDALTRASAVGLGKPDPQRPAHELHPEVPPRVGAWLMRALALHKEDRYPSADAMRRELAEIRSGITEQDPPTLPLPRAASPPPPTVAPATQVRRSPVPPVKPAERVARATPPPGKGGRRALWVGLGLILAIGVALSAGWTLWSRRSPAGETTATGARIEFVEGEGFELKWAGDDLWFLYRGKESLKSHSGAGGWPVAPDRYRIAAVYSAFEPVEFTVEAGRKTVVSLGSGSFDLTWAGGDLWFLYRGKEAVKSSSGAGGWLVSPGRYRIAAVYSAFEPIEFTVEEGKKTEVSRPSGSFELQWAGDDLWFLYRGKEAVKSSSGAGGWLVSPGRYRITAVNSAFEPVEFTVEEGKKTVVTRPSGSFEFQGAGAGLWFLYRGKDAVNSHSGAGGWLVSPGDYRIAPVDPAAFKPIEFTVRQDQKTIVGPRGG